MQVDDYRAVDTPTEDERLAPGYRRERADRARTGHARFEPDGTRVEVREYVTAPDEENDAIAALEQALPDGWVARWVLAEQGGGLVVRSLTVEPEGRTTPTGGVTANRLRTLSPAGVLSHLHALALEAARVAQRNPDQLSPGALALVVRQGLARQRIPERQPPAPPSGRPALPDEFLVAVALAYVEESAAGAGVYVRLSKRLGRLRGTRRRVPDATIKDWIRTARARGFLAPAGKQGRRGGEPGPRLLAYLEQQQQQQQQNGDNHVDNDD